MKPVFVLFLGTLTIFGRVTTTRPVPEASVWFEPNAGQVKGRTEFVGRTRGTYLYMTGREVVYAMAPAKVEHGAKMRQVRMEFAEAASRKAADQPAFQRFFAAGTLPDKP